MKKIKNNLVVNLIIAILALASFLVFLLDKTVDLFKGKTLSIIYYFIAFILLIAAVVIFIKKMDVQNKKIKLLAFIELVLNVIAFILIIRQTYLSITIGLIIYFRGFVELLYPYITTANLSKKNFFIGILMLTLGSFLLFSGRVKDDDYVYFLLAILLIIGLYTLIISINLIKNKKKNKLPKTNEINNNNSNNNTTKKEEVGENNEGRN